MIRIRKGINLPMLIDAMRQMFRFFCFVLTLVIIFSGVMARFATEEWILYTHDLMRFLLVSFFSVLPMMINLIFVSSTIKGMYVLRAAQFVVTTILAMGTLILYRTPEAGIDTMTAIIYFFIFLGIYAFFLIRFVQEHGVASRINKELDVLRRNENATQPK